MTDDHTDELFPITPAEAGRLIFPLSRLVCDVERFPSDAEEPMANRGMGVIYTRTSAAHDHVPTIRSVKWYSLKKESRGIVPAGPEAAGDVARF
jgi:N-formylglutamate amidohydrolase